MATAKVYDGSTWIEITDESHRADAADAHNASAIDYDNTTSGLTATNSQDAIDELAASPGGGASDLDDLTDVDVTTTPPNDGEVLAFDTADSLWKPAAPTGGGLADQGTFTYLDATEGAAPSAPASGFARIYAKSDGRIYSKDDAGTEYGPFDAAGGGGSFSGFPIDTPPGTAHAKDDEFTGSSLDVKWTNPTTSAVAACPVTVANGVLRLDTPASGIRVAGIRQAAPTGSFTVSASVMYTDTYTFDIRLGVFVGVAGGKGHVCGPFPQDLQSGFIGVTTISNTLAWSSYDGTLTVHNPGDSRQGRYRIRWISGTSTLGFDWWNGVAWHQIGTRTGMTQPDQIGLCIYGNGNIGAATPKMYVDWFRVTEP